MALAYSESSNSLLSKLRTDTFMGRGASIRFLSAFPGEAEMLFPPLTMLKVQRQPGRKQTHFVPEEVTAKKANGDEVTYTRIVVKPSFV